MSHVSQEGSFSFIANCNIMERDGSLGFVPEIRLIFEYYVSSEPDDFYGNAAFFLRYVLCDGFAAGKLNSSEEKCFTKKSAFSSLTGLLGSQDLPSHNGLSDSNPVLNGQGSAPNGPHDVQSSSRTHTLAPLQGPSLWTNTHTTSANTTGKTSSED